MIGLAVVLLSSLMIFLARRASPEGTVLGVLLSVLTATTLVDQQGFWMTEAWSGLFIGLSLSAYLWQRWTPGALLGLAALFLRELAAPYCLVCLYLAVRASRRREAAVWFAGFVVFAIFYVVHVDRLLGEIRPDDPAHEGSWLQFGGLGFWLATLAVNRAFVAVPRVVLTAGAVLLAASAWSRSLPSHVGYTVAAYTVFFLVVGQPFNNYWGLVAAVPFALGITYGLDGLSTLVIQAASRQEV
jgi:hypothetical protein